MDAGIPQAEARGEDKRARAAWILAFYRVCTRALRAYPSESWKDRARKPRVRAPGSSGRVEAAALKPLWNWRVFSLSGSTVPRCARIAITQATVRPAHGAAIVEAERDEGVSPPTLCNSPACKSSIACRSLPKASWAWWLCYVPPVALENHGSIHRRGRSDPRSDQHFALDIPKISGIIRRTSPWGTLRHACFGSAGTTQDPQLL